MLFDINQRLFVQFDQQCSRRSFWWASTVLIIDAAPHNIFDKPSTDEAKIIIEMWRKHYNTIRPPSSLGYKPPAPVTVLPADLASAMWTLQPVRRSNGRNLVVT